MSRVLEADQRRTWMKSRRKMRKATRRARTRRQMLRFLLLMVLFFSGAACFTHLPWAMHGQESQIEVKGNHVVTTAQVVKALNGSTDVAVYKLDPQVLQSRLTSLKAVRHAFVRRYALPQPRLIVDILEEYPWASYARAPGEPIQAVIAQSGRFIPVSEFPNVDRPHMIIYGQPTLKLTQKQVVQWASWANYIAGQTGRTVDAIDMRQPFDVRVANGDLTLKLGIPDASLTRRLGRLVSVLPAVEPIKEKLEYIDLGLDNSVPLKVNKNLPPEKLRELAAQKQKVAVGVNGVETKPEPN